MTANFSWRFTMEIPDGAVSNNAATTEEVFAAFGIRNKSVGLFR